MPCRELWQTDGTKVGTVMVEDFRPGIGWSDPKELEDAGGVLYFQAIQSGIWAELFRLAPVWCAPEGSISCVA